MTLGALLPEESRGGTTELAFKYAIYRINKDRSLAPNATFVYDIQYVTREDSFHAGKRGESSPLLLSSPCVCVCVCQLAVPSLSLHCTCGCRCVCAFLGYFISRYSKMPQSCEVYFFFPLQLTPESPSLTSPSLLDDDDGARRKEREAGSREWN